MAKRKTNKGPERMSVHHDKEKNTVFLCVYDGVLSGTVTMTPEQAIAIGEVGEMDKVYREETEDKV